MGGILTGSEIHKMVDQGKIFIDDFDPKNLGPNSYDLKLHDELKIYDFGIRHPLDWDVLDMKKTQPTKSFTIGKEGFTLMPDQLYLARTVERTVTDHFVPMIEGRSSIGRLGMSIHVTAGFGDIGFDNYWTLEMHVIQPVKIYPFVRVCQVYFLVPEGETTLKYNGKYQQKRTQGIGSSKLWEELDG